MSAHRCSDWSESKVTAGQRRAADRQMDKHVDRYPGCAAADVCVHSGLLIDAAYCCGCGRRI